MFMKKWFPVRDDSYVPLILGICLTIFMLFYFVHKNYVLFHILMDMTVVLVSFCVCIITLNTFKLTGDRFYTTIGIGYGFSAILLALHILVGLGIYIVPGLSYNYAAYLAFSGRAVQTVTILISLAKKEKHRQLGRSLILVFVVAAAAIVFAKVMNLLPPFFTVTFTIWAKFSYGLLAALALVNFYLVGDSQNQLPLDVRSNLMVAQALDAVEFCVFSQANTQGDFGSVLFTILSAMSSYFFYRAMIKPILTAPIEVLCQDIASKNEQLKQQEDQMARLQQFNMIGRMAATIAHEVRNPLTTVRGYLQYINQKKQFEAYREQLDMMTAELDRANAIITDYLSLASNRYVVKTPDRLERIIRSLAPLLVATAEMEHKRVLFDLGNTRELCLYEREIRQLVLNLARNGLEAVEETGTVVISTRMEADRIVLAVTDNGGGISAEVLEKMGQPFLTTKTHGTGLGLAVCYSIAAKHNAGIKAYNSEIGAVFEVVFAEEAAAALGS